MICILAAVAANSGRGSDIVKQIPRVASAPGRTYTYLNLAGAIRAIKAGKDINYEGVGDRSTSTRTATSRPPCTTSTRTRTASRTSSDS